MRHKLIEIRNSRGYTPELVAVRAGISINEYIKTESGEHDPSKAEWLRIVRALNLPAGCVEELQGELKNVVCNHPDCPIVIGKIDNDGIIRIKNNYNDCEDCGREFCDRHIGVHVCAKAVK